MGAGVRGAAVIVVVVIGVTGCVSDKVTDEDCRVAALRWNGPPELASACNVLISERDYSDPARTDWRTSYSYDADGKLSLEEVDDGIDSTVDGRVVYGYDPDGTLRFTDSEFEGGAWRENYEYDDAGDRISIEFVWGEGGHTNALYTYGHDALGNVVTEVHDWDTDGIADYRISWDYDGCDPQTETRQSASSDPTQVLSYGYDEHGNLVSVERDRGNDGDIDSRSTYSHDTDGNVVSEEHDSGANGTVDTRVTYTYDTRGNRLTEIRDDDLDGAPNFSATHAYDCP